MGMPAATSSSCLEHAAIAAVESVTLPQIQAGRPPRRHAIHKRSPAMAVRTPLAVAPRPRTVRIAVVHHSRSLRAQISAQPRWRSAVRTSRLEEPTQTFQVWRHSASTWPRQASAREVMRSATAVRGRCRRTAAIGYDSGLAFPQVSPGVVGLAGLEPAPSSLSAIEGSPLCNPAFLQVARIRNRRSNALFERAAEGRSRLAREVRPQGSRHSHSHAVLALKVPLTCTKPLPDQPIQHPIPRPAPPLLNLLTIRQQTHSP
jgi:hypothetical protein